MIKLGIGSIPITGDQVSINMIGSNPILGVVINWGAEDCNQHWVVLKNNEGQIQINIAHIQSYRIKPRHVEEYNLAKKEKIVKPELYHENAPCTIKREGGNQVENIVSRTIANSAKGVEELVSSNIHLDDPIKRAQQLAELYNKKQQMIKEQIKDHMLRNDLIEVSENYAMPSFKKRT